MRRLDWLYRVFERSTAETFMIWREQTFNYGWLLGQILVWGKRLREVNAAPGTVLSIEGDYSPETVALLLASIELGCIVAPLATGLPAQREEFKNISEVQVAIAFSGGDQFSITVRDIEVRNPLTRKLAIQADGKGNPGLIVFSSGSTGKSKAALHDFTLLLEKFKVRRHSLVTLMMLALDHLGGLNTLFYVLSNGGTIVFMEGRDPETVCRAIDCHSVALLPTSPTFLNLLLISEAYKRHNLSSLRRITYGTEVMPLRTLQRLHEILPGVDLLQTYGLSELGVLRSKSRSTDSLWVKVGGEDFETKVKEGTLWVRAKSAMLGYLNAPSPFDSDGWFNTGDSVEVDGEYIRILGRKSELINVGGEKVYPVEVENVLLEMENVEDVAVSGAPNSITGQIVVARFSLSGPEELRDFRKRMREFCRGRLAAFKIPAKIEIAEEALYGERFKKMRGLPVRFGGAE
jgi:acyl-CoA synthetase (AMP-forming)/AMP-acid ligase II